MNGWSIQVKRGTIQVITMQLNGFLGGCLPIYIGSSSDVYSVFSKDSFVFYNINDPQPALELLRRLSTNESLYEEMLTKPILKDGNSTVDAYFSLFPENGDGSINRQIREMMGLPSYKPK
jgi:hypothetical protein